MDFLQFLPASVLPNVAAAVKTFGEPPELNKPNKEKVEGTLGKIAVRSMDNCVGLITYAIAKAWAIGKHDIIPRLAQELQIEVDSLKNVQRADRGYIEDVLKAMGKIEIPWLADYKESDTFTSRPIATGSGDTISRLSTAVNAIWQQFVPKQRSLVEFRELFSDAPVSWKTRAAVRREEYQQQIKAAAQTNNIGQVIENLRGLAKAIPDQHKMTAAAAFWQVCHLQKSGTASMVFHAFLNQIIERLREPRLQRLMIVGTNYGVFAPRRENKNVPPLHECFENAVMELTIVESLQYPGRLAVRCGDRHFGLLAADSWKPPVNSTITMVLHSYKSTVIALPTKDEVSF